MRNKLGMLALVLFVIVPLAMAPNVPEKLGHDTLRKQGNPTSGSKLDRAKVELARSVQATTSADCYYPLCGGLVIEERDASDNVMREVVYAGATPLWQILFDGSSQYLHEDPRGNVAMLTEGTGLPTAAAGDILELITYDAYGKPLFQDANSQNKTDGGGNFLAASDFDNTLLFMAAWYDPETGNRGRAINSDFGGLYALGGRYLNPDEGRFISRAAGGDPDRPIITGRVYNSAGRNGLAGHAPVNGNGDAASGLPTGKRQHKPFTVTKAVDKAASKKLFVGGIAWLTEAPGRIPTHNPEWTNLNDADPGVASKKL